MKSIFKTSLSFIFLICFSFVLQAQIEIEIPKPKWNYENDYRFDKSNSFEVYFYGKKSKLLSKLDYKTHYQSFGGMFSVSHRENNRLKLETVFDTKNQIVVQKFGEGTEAYYNIAGYFIPEGKKIKRLELIPTEESKIILGYRCKKYIYALKNITGEAWITDEVKLTNEVGIFRASKYSKYHNGDVPEGFIMEMTSRAKNGSVTLMKTIALEQQEDYYLNFSNEKVNTSINRGNYYDF